MSTYDAPVGTVERRAIERPWAAPAIGGAIYGIAVAVNLMTSTDHEQGFKEWAISVLIAVLGVAFAAWLVSRAQNIGRLSLILGIVSIVTIVVFYLGLPCVFGATAIALGLRTRRTPGPSNGPALAGIVLGALALGFGAFIMVVG